MITLSLRIDTHITLDLTGVKKGGASLKSPCKRGRGDLGFGNDGL